MPGLDNTAIYAPIDPATDALKRKQAEDDAMLAERKQNLLTSQAALADRQQKQLGSTMKVDALQWTQQPQYQQPWAKAPAEARQHFVDAYGDAAATAPEAWNSSLQQNTGLIPGLEHLATGESAHVSPSGEVTRTFEGPPREPAHYFQTGTPVSRFDPATGKTVQIGDPEAAAELSSGDDALIDKIGSYEAPAPWMRGGYPPAQKARLSAILAQRYPDYDAKEYAARQTALQGFKSGIQARNITSANTVVGHLGSLNEAAKALNNRSLPAWNYIANSAESASGDPRLSRFNTARDAVVTELASLFKGTGAAPSAEEIKHWRDNINPSMSPDQISGVISEMTGLMKSRLDALQEQWDKGVKAPRDKPFLTPKSLAILRTLSRENPSVPAPESIDPVAAQAPQGAQQPQANITKDAYDALPSGSPYTWNGKQLIKK